MLIRTVLDCNARDPKFYSCVLLLVGSWCQRVQHNFSLDVVITGDAPPSLLRFFDRHGVSWQTARSDHRLEFVSTGNTLLGGYEKGEHNRIMLIDNDVYFLGDLTELGKVCPNVFAGAPAGSQRLSATQWNLIENDIGLTRVEGNWVPPRCEWAHLTGQGASPRHEKYAYINGGVLLLPNDEMFMKNWQTNIISIAEYFRGTPHQSEAVCNSNMAGLATAVGEHKVFKWLDDTYNYRHLHVLLHKANFEEISIIHMTGHPNQKGELNTQAYVSDYATMYWKRRMSDVLMKFKGTYEPKTADAVQNTIDRCLAAMLNTISEFNLDAIMKEIFEDSKSHTRR